MASELLLPVAIFGNELNVPKPKRGKDPSIAKPCETQLAAILTGCVTAPDRCTEVADNLRLRGFGLRRANRRR